VYTIIFLPKNRYKNELSLKVLGTDKNSERALATPSIIMNPTPHGKIIALNIYLLEKKPLSTLITEQSAFQATITSPGHKHVQKEGMSTSPCESICFNSSTSSKMTLLLIIILISSHQDNPFEV
jgi:hypothetical protein